MCTSPSRSSRTCSRERWARCPRNNPNVMALKKLPQRPAWGKIVAAALVLVALAALWRYTPVSQFLTAERLVAWARVVRATRWAPLALVLAYTPAAFLMFPRPLL